MINMKAFPDDEFVYKYLAGPVLTKQEIEDGVEEGNCRFALQLYFYKIRNYFFERDDIYLPGGYKVLGDFIYKEEVAKSYVDMKVILAKNQENTDGRLDTGAKNVQAMMDEMKRYVIAAKADIAKTTGGPGGASGNSRVRDVMDPSKELIIPPLKDGASKEEFNAWRLAAELRIEVLPGCQNCGPLLKEIRASPTEIDDLTFNEIVIKLTQESKMSASDLTHWEYESRSMQLFLLLQGKLNRSSSKICAKATRDRNGFELFRLACREMEVEFEGLDFRLDMEIRDMAFRTSKNPAELKKHIIELDAAMDNFQAKTDQEYSHIDAYKILWRLLDPVSLKEAEEKKRSLANDDT